MDESLPGFFIGSLPNAFQEGDGRGIHYGWTGSQKWGVGPTHAFYAVVDSSSIFAHEHKPSCPTSQPSHFTTYRNFDKKIHLPVPLRLRKVVADMLSNLDTTPKSAAAPARWPGGVARCCRTTNRIAPTWRNCRCILSRAAAGLGKALMRAAESTTALEADRTLLVLDTVTGSDTERIYARLEWQLCG